MSGERLTFVVRHRFLVRAALVVVAAGLALAIPRLEMRFAPEELVAPDDDAARESSEMERAFGPDEEAIVVLVRADDVLAEEPLAWGHAIAAFLETQPAVERVESLGTTPLPGASGDAETLDDLEESEEEIARRARAEDALVAAVASDPDRFPEGLASLAARGQGPIVIGPLVAGERPTAEERARIAKVVGQSALVRGRLVSEDRGVMVVAAILRVDAHDEDASDAVEALVARLAEHPPPPGVRAHLAGLPTMRVTMVQALRDDQLLLVSLATIGSFLVLALGMRSRAGVLLPMGAVGITLAITMGSMALAGEPINLLTNVIPPLLVTIGLSEAVHMVLRYREEHAACDGDRTRAASRTLRAMWLPCFVTTFTTSIGFGALILQETEILRRFGIIAAIATMLSYVVTVLFVPASLPDFGARSPAPREVRAARGLDRMVGILARATARRPWVTIVASAMLMIGSLAIARNVVVDSTLLDQFDRDSELAQVTRLMEAELDGIRQVSIGVDAEPGRFFSARGISELDVLAEWLREQPGVLRATTHADWLHESWVLITGEESARSERLASDSQVDALRTLVSSAPIDPLARYVTADGGSARIEVRLADRGASRILAMLERFEARASELEGVRVRFSGEAWDASRGLDRIVRSLGSLASAVALIFVVMTLLFRSVRLGLLSIPPNALPLAMTLAYMVARGIPLHAATVIVFTVTIGLAVDGATHVIARFREELARGGPGEATLVRTMETSGRGVILSSATLLLGYGALLFSAFEPVRLFGELSAVAIGASLVAQLLLLPALLSAFVGRRDVPPSA